MSEAEQVWNAAAAILRAQVSEVVWLSTFQDVRALDCDSERFVLSAPSAYVRERLEGRYLPLVQDALDEIGVPSRSLVVEVRPERQAEPVAVGVPAAPLQPVVAEPGLAAHAAANGNGADPRDRPVPGRRPSGPADGLNPRYTFENFIIGPSNFFAHAAALRVAETPARSYNPLFVYGAAGLGKTHLLHAIGHYVNQNYTHYQVRYVSTESFMNEYVDAIRNDTIAGFKRRYRDVDVLLIDDIQFMEHKERLQEEFFHTFNSLHGANKQIVISSDRMPDAIPTLEDRLRGRFKWGLITDIQPPDLETRLAILRTKAEREMAPVPPEVLEFIATRVTSNIRELEGALIRVSAYASLNRVPITVTLAEGVLADLLSGLQPKVLTPAAMLDQIATFFGFTPDQLRGKSRQRPLVTARQIGMYVFRELTDLSYPAIAREFGGRDHTTVIHAVEKVTRLMKERHQVYDQVIELLQRMKNPP